MDSIKTYRLHFTFLVYYMSEGYDVYYPGISKDMVMPGQLVYCACLKSSNLQIRQIKVQTMNGRIYDPTLGMFLSPDNHIQAPDMTHNFNRYAYCFNNPMVYTDPSGELTFIDPFTSALTAWTMGFVDELFNSNSSFGDALAEGDRRAHNSWEISEGLILADPGSGSDFNEGLQVASRLTYQEPMTSIGYTYAQFCNMFGRVDVEHWRGATVISDPGIEGALSMGGYIRINPDEGPLDLNNVTLVHEYGHFVQTRNWGGVATLFGAILSGLSAWDITEWRSTQTHDEIWFEQDANARALAYFEGEMTTEQITTYTETGHPNQNYYDQHFLRNMLYPDLFTLLIIDRIWSD